MTKVKTLMLMLIALLLIVPNVAASPIQDSDDIEAEGLVEAVGSGSLTVNGTTFIVSDDTVITTGRGRGTSAELSEISEGVWVSVSGYTDAEGSVIANKVKIKPWVNTETDPDTDPDDEDEGDITTKPEHPIALWMAYRFDLEYDDLMAMHEAGIGWGNIVKSYHLARANPQLEVTGQELLDMRMEGKGWGNITRELDTSELGTKPGKTPPAWGRDKDRPHPNPNAGPKK